MPAGVITTGSHPKALWPGVYAWFGVSYNEYPPQWKELVYETTSTKNYEELVQQTGMGLVPVKPQGQGTAYDSMVQGPTTRITHSTFSLGYQVTWEELNDNLYEEVSKARAGELAFSFRQTKEIDIANIYNNAFDSAYKGGDGVSLLNTAHPNTTGGTFSNMLATGSDLNEAALEDLIIQMMGATDDRGKTISLMPTKLIVPRGEWFNANRILKSVFQPGNANNDINALKATNAIPGGIVLNQYLTDQGAWFLRSNISNGKGLIYFQRASLEFMQDNDFDTDNLKAKGRERWSRGWGDPRALWGSAGA